MHFAPSVVHHFGGEDLAQAGLVQAVPAVLPAHAVSAPRPASAGVVKRAATTATLQYLDIGDLRVGEGEGGTVDHSNMSRGQIRN